MQWDYVITKSLGSCGMQPKSVPLDAWDKENQTEVVAEFSWTCETGKCTSKQMCLKCICYSGQKYYDYWGWGTYPPPWKED